MENLFEQHASSDMMFYLDSFEGSIELLVSLCKMNGLDIHTVKISSITDQYLQYMEGIEYSDMDMDKTTDFLLMAATLLELKARSVLPQEELDEDNEEEFDTEDELRRRMIEYDMFKSKAEEIKEQETLNRFYREPQFTDEDARVSMIGFNLDKLMEAYAKVLFRFTREEEMPAVKTIDRDEFTVEDKINELVKTLINDHEVKFFDLFQEDFSKSEVVTTFLALLELINKQFAVVIQPDNFGDIAIAINGECNPDEYDYSSLAMSEDEAIEDKKGK